MKPEYVALLSGLIGAFLGALGSIAAVWLQQRGQDRQNNALLIINTAIKAYESAERYAEFMANQGKEAVSPELAYFVILYGKLIESISSRKAISKEQWLAAHREANDLHKAVSEHYEDKARRG